MKETVIECTIHFDVLDTRKVVTRQLQEPFERSIISGQDQALSLLVQSPHELNVQVLNAIHYFCVTLFFIEYF